MLLHGQQPFDLRLAIFDLAPGSGPAFGFGQQQKLVTPELQRVPGLDQFVVDLSKQPVTRHTTPTPEPDA